MTPRTDVWGNLPRAGQGQGEWGGQKAETKQEPQPLSGHRLAVPLHQPSGRLALVNPFHRCGTGGMESQPAALKRRERGPQAGTG